MAKERYHNLDYLRGICALGIMIYHYSWWVLGKYSGTDFMGRVGVYCVSMFYVLSGLTLFLVYENRLSLNVSSLKSFFIKRIFRIFPLIWLVLIFHVFFYFASLDLNWYLKSFTGIFSITDWSLSLPLGMWSIGSELAFYLFFPLLLFVMKKGRIYIFLLSFFIFLLYGYFAFFGYTEFNSISEGVDVYKNPLNQIGIFYMGMLIGYVFVDRKIENWILFLLLAASLLVFVFYPSGGKVLTIIEKFPRLIFTICCGLITLSIFKIRVVVPVKIHKFLSYIGSISYSIYLIYPIMWILSTTPSLQIRYTLILAITLTFVVSGIIYKFVEMPIRDYGRRIA